MSYAIYTTEAIVLRVVPNGEANSDVVLFTRDLGKITVRAQSARKQESKMRMYLTRFRVVVVDLVKGKNTWRLTGITGDPIGNQVYADGIVQSLARVIRLSEFLIHGEEAHPALYDFFKYYLSGIGHNVPTVAVNYSKGFEIVGVIKLLEYLGYWHGSQMDNAVTSALIEECYINRRVLVKQINESISATQIVVY